MNKQEKTTLTLFWFRRDLRLHDNAGLYRALKNEGNIQPIFIFDRHILDKLEDKNDRRVTFIHHRVAQLKRQLESHGSTLWVFYGTPKEVCASLMSKYLIQSLYANRDYEPYARQRDKGVHELLSQHNIPFRAFKDQVIFEKDEVLKPNGDPYTVYTPYSKRWKSELNEFYLRSYPTENYLDRLHSCAPSELISLEEMGFEQHTNDWPNAEADLEIIRNYHETRDIPSIHGTSRLSVHLRFGTLSVRDLSKLARKENGKWFNELIWREFYQSILWHFPYVVDKSFKPPYDRIEWRNNEEEFQAWCEGRTGFPIVDAGMRELNNTGFMHNRVRMITASFLVKDLLVDWRWGEAYFARKLIDFDLASNNGGWQWAAGSGVDAAPYFRIFNPYIQTEKFDPDRKYIQQWVPEFKTDNYPKPIVDHAEARERALRVYKVGLGKE